jgi:hypothetical protein
LIAEGKWNGRCRGLQDHCLSSKKKNEEEKVLNAIPAGDQGLEIGGQTANNLNWKLFLLGPFIYGVGCCFSARLVPSLSFMAAVSTALILTMPLFITDHCSRPQFD